MRIKMGNFQSLEQFQETMHKLIDGYYELKGGTGNIRQERIKRDLNALVYAAKQKGIEVDWFPL